MEELLKSIRHQFFSLRNGMIADVYRRAGAPYKTVFGLQVPQLAGIARELNCDETLRQSLAERLWKEKDIRESRLLACWLFDKEKIELSKLESECQTQEEKDILHFATRRG